MEPLPNKPSSTLREQLAASHTPDKVSYRLQNKEEKGYLKDFVYGAVDGAVTTFAVVSGVAGANLPPQIIIIMGIANLVADGFSMAVSNYLGVKTEKQLHDKARSQEQVHIAVYPEGEKEEIRQIFANKGFSGDILDKAVQIITADKKLWENTMLHEEYGLPPVDSVAWKAALTTFIAFLLIGFIPISPFLWNYSFRYELSRPFLWSIMTTGCAFFLVGAIKSKFVNKVWYRSGFETLFLGGSAAILAYLIGDLLAGLV